MENIKLVYDTPMQVGESPVWHAEERALYWIDIGGFAVHRLQPETNVHCSWKMPSEPGCIALCSTGGLIAALRSGLMLLDTDSGLLTPVADAPYDTKTMRFNDGRCDSVGRLWVGTLYEPRDQQAGNLFCVERGVIRKANVNPVTVSNGVAFSINGQILFHADTTAHRICTYDFDPATGQVSNGRLFKQFSADKSCNYGGRPDGAAVDAEGCYWVALFEGGCVKRLSPEGEVVKTIELPFKCPTMMAFGGDDLRTLYITSARHNRSEAEIAHHPWSGCVVSVRVGVPGRMEARYAP